MKSGKTAAIMMPLVAVVLCFYCLGTVHGNCGGLQGDVVFLLDTSGSVGSSNFQTMLTFVGHLVDDFDIGPANVRVGVVKFGTSATIEFDLNDYMVKGSLKNRIASISYISGGTNTASAIQTMHSTVFTAARGERSNIPNVAIVLTDGQSNSASSTASAAASARAAGITIFSIGIGTGVTELNAMATDPDSGHVFTVSSFSGLNNILGTFQTKACTSSVFSGTLTETTTTTTTTTTTPTTPTTESSSGGVIAGGVVAGAAALGMGIAGAVIYSKVMAAKTAVSSLQSGAQATVENGVQNEQPNQNNSQGEDDSGIPGMVDAPAQMQPMDTRLPARLPPINRF